MKNVPVRRHLRRRDGLYYRRATPVARQERREREYSPEELKRLARVDYVELPTGDWVNHGFSCETCRFFNGAMCTNNAIDAPVLPNGCCNAYDAPKREQFRARKAFEQ